MTFSPDSHLLATLDDGGDVRVLEWETGRVVTNLSAGPLRARPMGVVAFSPDGTWLAIGVELGKVRLLDLHSGKEMLFGRPTIDGVTALSFSRNGELVAANIGKEILLWETGSGNLRALLTNHTGEVFGLDFTPDGRQLVSAAWDRTIRVWSTTDYAALGFLQNSVEAFRASSLLPDGRTLVTGGSGGSICLWDITGVTNTPPQTHLTVSLGYDSLVGVDPRSLKAEALDEKLARRFGLAFSSENWDFITMDRAGSLEVRDARTFRVSESLASLGSNYWGVALSPDAHWLAFADTSGKLAIWDWSARSAVTNFTIPFEWFGKLRFSRSGHFFFASVVNNKSVVTTRMWRTAGWEEIKLPQSLLARHWSFDLSADDQFLAVGYGGGAVKIFRFPSGSLEVGLPGHHGGVLAVLFWPNNGELVSASADGTARVWSLSDRRQVAELKGHPEAIYGEAISPDGRRLATGGSASSDAVKLWDPFARRELLTLEGEGLCFLNLAFSPDGKTLMAQSLDGHTHLWRAPSWEEIAATEQDDHK